MEQEKFEQWAIIELFGHHKISGLLGEQNIGGETFIRVDVPETDGQPGYTKLYGKGAIYGITLTDQETARAAAKYYAPRPMDLWSERQMLGMPAPQGDPDQEAERPEDFEEE